MTYFDETHATSGSARQPIPIIPHPHTASEPCPGGCDDILEVEEAACKMKSDISELDRRIEESHTQMTNLERRSEENAKQMVRLETRADEASKQMVRVESAVSITNAKLDKNTTDTSEILEIMQSGRAFFRFAEKAGKILQWTLGIATAVLAFIVAFQAFVK